MEFDILRHGFRSSILATRQSWGNERRITKFYYPRDEPGTAVWSQNTVWLSYVGIYVRMMILNCQMVNAETKP